MNHNNETNISNAMDLSEVQNRIFKAYMLENSLNEVEIAMFKAYLLAYPLYNDVKNTNDYTMKFIIKNTFLYNS
jgi:hypothetical protein